MADQVTTSPATPEATLPTPPPRPKRGGLTMPTNPGKELQDMMLRQMEKEPGAAQATAPSDPSTPSDPSPEPVNITSNTESNITAHITDNITGNIAAQKQSNADTQASAQEDEQEGAQTSEHVSEQEERQAERQSESRADAPPPAKLRRNAPAQEAAPPAGKKSAREAAQEKARKLGATAQVPITLRLAEGLNDEVDDLAHRHRKGRVKKQDLITLAVQLLITELGSGTDIEDLLETYGKSGR